MCADRERVESGSSRRAFLERTAMLGGCALAGGLSAARSAHAAGTERINVALVGCGRRGTGALANCLDAHPSTRLVAMADVFEERPRQALNMLKSKEYGERIDLPPERTFIGFDAYKQALACDPDLMLLATPPGFRPEHYRAAVEAGKHVFMEKPVCVDAPGYRMIVEASKLADRKGLKVCVGHNMRREPQVRELVERIRDGAVGEILFLQVYGLTPLGTIFPRDAEQTELEYQLRHWSGFVWLGGGRIVEAGGCIHYLDIANWIKGEHPVEANSLGGRQTPHGPEGGQVFDHHAVEYTCADGTKMFVQARFMAGPWTAGSAIVHGTEGVGGFRVPSGFLTRYGRLSSALDGILGPNAWTYPRRRPSTARGRGGPIVSGFVQEHVELIHAIRNNSPYNDGYWGGATSMTAILGRMASYSGQVVRWDEAVERGPAEFPYGQQLTLDSTPPVLPDKSGRYELPMPGVYKAY